MAVSTMRTVRRGLERERKEEMVRRSECDGCAAATVVRREEASSAGRTASGASAAEEMGWDAGEAEAAARRAAWRLRCGRWWLAAGAGGAWSSSFVLEEGDVAAAEEEELLGVGLKAMRTMKLFARK